MLKKILIVCIFLFSQFGCVYDPPNPGPDMVYNCSDQAVYVYHSMEGNLELEPKLELFETKKKEFMFENTGCDNLLQAPIYRINAYEEKELPNPYLAMDYVDNDSLYSDSLYFYFITEQTMKANPWDSIVKKGMYERHIRMSRREYFDLFRSVTYVAK